jgi:hypothetical protein
VRSHPQSTCEGSQNSSHDSYLEKIISRRVFEKRKSLIPGIW